MWVVKLQSESKGRPRPSPIGFIKGGKSKSPPFFKFKKKLTQGLTSIKCTRHVAHVALSIVLMTVGLSQRGYDTWKRVNPVTRIRAEQHGTLFGSSVESLDGRSRTKSHLLPF